MGILKLNNIFVNTHGLFFRLRDRGIWGGGGGGSGEVKIWIRAKAINRRNGLHISWNIAYVKTNFKIKYFQINTVGFTYWET